MSRNVEDNQTIRRYLLDDLAPEERRRLEERLLDDGDDDFFEQLQLAEAELADDYVADELSATDRARFTKFFLSTPERHEQLRFAETLQGYFSGSERSKKTVAVEERVPSGWIEKLSLLLGLNRPRVGFALSCGLVLAVSVAAWLGLRAWQLNDQLERLQAQQPSTPVNADALATLQQQLADERMRHEAAARELSRERDTRAGLEQEVARLRAGDAGELATHKPPPGQNIKPPPQSEPRLTASRVLAVTLTPGLVRGSGETKTLRLTPATTSVRLRLDIGVNDHKRYRARLETAEGKSLLERDSLPPRSASGGRVVIMDVPAKLLKGGGDFILRLSGVADGEANDPIDSYQFRVLRN